MPENTPMEIEGLFKQVYGRMSMVGQLPEKLDMGNMELILNLLPGDFEDSARVILEPANWAMSRSGLFSMQH